MRPTYMSTDEKRVDVEHLGVNADTGVLLEGFEKMPMRLRPLLLRGERSKGIGGNFAK